MPNNSVITDIQQVTFVSQETQETNAIVRNTFPRYRQSSETRSPHSRFPAEIRAPQGSLQGVSGFQVRIGAKDVFNSGDKTDVLVAMNPAALKVNAQYLKRGSIVLYDTDSFQKKDLDKALYTTQDPFSELKLEHVQPVEWPSPH